MDKAGVEQKPSTDTQPQSTVKPQSNALPKGSMPRFETSSKPVSKKPKSSAGIAKGRKRAHPDADEDENGGGFGKRMKVAEETSAGPEITTEEEPRIFTQPALITGAKLKKYQLEGVAWMAGLYQNGISGILGMFCSSALGSNIAYSFHSG